MLLINLALSQGNKGTLPPVSLGTFPPYPPGPYTEGFFVGTTDYGNDFLTVGGIDGRAVSAIDVWKDDGSGDIGIRGVQLTYTDGTVSSIGDVGRGAKSTITFTSGERITSATLWGNGDGRLLGRIRFVTNKQVFDWGKRTSGQEQYEAPIGSGVLVGSAGRAGAVVDLLSWVFLEEVQSFSINNLQVSPDPNGTSAGITTVSLSESWYHNNGTEPVTWICADSTTRTNSVSFQQTHSNTFGVSASVTASAFDIVQVSAGFQWSETTEVTTGTETSQEITLSWSLQGTLQPNSSILCTAITQQGILKSFYTATATVVLKSGFTFSYPVGGEYNNVFFDEASVTATAQDGTLVVNRTLNANDTVNLPSENLPLNFTGPYQELFALNSTGNGTSLVTRSGTGLVGHVLSWIGLGL